MSLTTLRRYLCLVLVLCVLLANQAQAVMAQTTQSAPLSTEYDKCSGTLYVLNNNHHWQQITRGHWTSVVVDTTDNTWYWRCGSSKEHSHADVDPNLVYRLNVFHSTQNRDITWKTYGESTGTTH